MAAAVEARLDPGADDFARRPVAEHAPAHREHVRVIVMARHLRRIDIVAERTTDALDLVAGNRNADARAAERDAAVRLAADDIGADLLRDIRVVNRRRAERADIRDLDEQSQGFIKSLFELI